MLTGTGKLKMTISKGDLFARADRTIEAVEVKEWGVTLHVKSLTEAERSKWDLSPMDVTQQKKGGTAISLTKERMQFQRAWLVVLATCYEDGAAFFDEPELDVVKLSGKNAHAVNTLYEAAARLSGITEQDVEESAKNFESSPDTDS